MEWTSIIVALIGALFAGGIISIFTIRESKKNLQLDNEGKEIENKEKEDNRWAKLCDELQDQIDKLNERCDKKDERIMELEDQKSVLQQKLDDANTNYVKVSLLKCNKLSCIDRQPPLGFTELTPEEMLLEKRRLAVNDIEE